MSNSEINLLWLTNISRGFKSNSGDILYDGLVPYPGRGECTDPVSEDAILGKGGDDSPDRVKGRQLASDTGGDKTWV